jgi:rhodanese-related sulfurtransferase
MTEARSLVAETGTASPAQAERHLRLHLALTTDAADVHHDLEHGVEGVIVVDARSAESYAAGHVPGALSLPHRRMDEAGTRHLPKGAILVVYCDGIGCNGSTKGALNLARLGFTVKEMLGGLDWWRRDGYPVAVGSEPGTLAQAAAAGCGC